MQNLFRLAIGHLVLTLDLREAGFELSFEQSPAVVKFLVPTQPRLTEADHRLRLVVRAVDSIEGGDTPDPIPVSWHYVTKGDRVTLYYRPPQSDGGWTHWLELDFQRRVGTLQIVSNDEKVLEYAELFPNRLDKFIFTSLLNTVGGCLVHSAAVRDGDHAIVLVGESGAGKSTSSRIWQSLDDPQVTPLTDECSLVQPLGDGSFWVYGTPWHSSAQVASPDGARLDRMYVLHHAPVNSASLLESSSALLQLLAQGQMSFWDAYGVGTALDTLIAVCRSVPIYSLGFVPDKSVVSYVRQQARAVAITS